jgi:hypothetical protein
MVTSHEENKNIEAYLDIETKEYFISFIDILGFENLILKNNQTPNLERVYLSVKRILHYLPQIHLTKETNDFYELYGPTPPLPPYAEEILTKNVYNFSDSIILFIESSSEFEDNVDRLNTISWITNAFIAESIITDKRVFQLPLRGAIAFGPATISPEKHIHIGQPIVDAYNLCNKLNWMGGSIHYSANKFVNKRICNFDRQIVEYKAPMPNSYKDKKKIIYALNWVLQHPNKKDLEAGNRRPRIEDIGYNHVMKHNWGKAEDKRDETMNFVEKICLEFDNRDQNNKI